MHRTDPEVDEVSDGTDNRLGFVARLFLENLGHDKRDRAPASPTNTVEHQPNEVRVPSIEMMSLDLFTFQNNFPLGFRSSFPGGPGDTWQRLTSPLRSGPERNGPV